MAAKFLFVVCIFPDAPDKVIPATEPIPNVPVTARLKVAAPLSDTRHVPQFKVPLTVPVNPVAIITSLDNVILAPELTFQVSNVMEEVPEMDFPVPVKVYVWVPVEFVIVPLFVKFPPKAIIPVWEVMYVTPDPIEKLPLTVKPPLPDPVTENDPEVDSKARLP